jgi:hypothetical protein
MLNPNLALLTRAKPIFVNSEKFGEKVGFKWTTKHFVEVHSMAVTILIADFNAERHFILIGLLILSTYTFIIIYPGIIIFAPFVSNVYVNCPIHFKMFLEYKWSRTENIMFTVQIPSLQKTLHRFLKCGNKIVLRSEI